MRVTVIGGGSWGTAFAVVLRDHGHEVTLACRDPEQVSAIVATGRNPRYVSHADLRGIAASTVSAAPVAEANLAVVAVPSAAYGATVAALPGTCPILSLTKGLDPATGNRLSTLVTNRPVTVLSGPNIAEEISRGLPAAVPHLRERPEPRHEGLRLLGRERVAQAVLARGRAGVDRLRQERVGERHASPDS